MTFEEWWANEMGQDYPTGRYIAEQAYLAGREAMRQECADHVFNLSQWDENNEQWVVLHRASTAMRHLK